MQLIAESIEFKPVLLKLETQEELNLIRACLGALPFVTIDAFGIGYSGGIYDMYDKLEAHATSCPKLHTIVVDE